MNYSFDIILVTIFYVLPHFFPNMTCILKQMALFILTISLCAILEEGTIIPFKDEK